MDTTSSEVQSIDLTSLRCSAGTDVGMRREENQDSFGIIERPGFKLFLVADGMGGVKGGGIASRLAIATMEEYFDDAHRVGCEELVNAVQTVNQLIFEKGSADPALTGMGTTIVGLAFTETALILCGVGDSRIYRIRGSEIRQLTEDHTLVKELVRSGALSEEQAENHPAAHMLTRSLGPTAEVQVDCRVLEEKPINGDVYILCSDGLYNLVHAEELARVVRESPIDDANQILIGMANQRGGNDNITAVLIAVGEHPDTRGSRRTTNRDLNAQSMSTDEEEFEESKDAPPRQAPRPQGIREKGKDSSPKRREADNESPTVRVKPEGTPTSFGVPLLLVIAAALTFGLVVGRLIRWDTTGEATSALTTLTPDLAPDLVPSRPDPEATVVVREIKSIEEPEPIRSDAALVRLRQTKEMFESSVTKIDSQLAALAKPISGEVGETLTAARKSAESLQLKLNEVDQSIDTASRKLSQWYGRQKRLETQDPIKLAAEVAASSKSVQDKKSALDQATYEFVQKRDDYELYPSDEKLREQVSALKDKRAETLRELQDEVRKTVSNVLAETDTLIDELKFQRDMLNIQLQSVKQDLEFAKSLADQNPETRSGMRAKLEQKKSGLNSSIAELDAVIAQRTSPLRGDSEE